MGLIEFLSVFGETGLVFTILMAVIYFLARFAYREKKAREEEQKKFNTYLIENQEKQIETIISFTNAMDVMKEKLIGIEAKIK